MILTFSGAVYDKLPRLNCLTISFGLFANGVEHLNYGTSALVITPVTARYVDSRGYVFNLHSGSTQLESGPGIFGFYAEISNNCQYTFSQRFILYHFEFIIQ
jgi:hypothetical protein